jgi:hypothetical protein
MLYLSSLPFALMIFEVTCLVLTRLLPLSFLLTFLSLSVADI